MARMSEKEWHQFAAAKGLDPTDGKPIEPPSEDNFQDIENPIIRWDDLAIVKHELQELRFQCRRWFLIACTAVTILAIITVFR
jgi:hypothetical protein